MKRLLRWSGSVGLFCVAVIAFATSINTGTVRYYGTEYKKDGVVTYTISANVPYQATFSDSTCKCDNRAFIVEERTTSPYTSEEIGAASFVAPESTIISDINAFIGKE